MFGHSIYDSNDIEELAQIQSDLREEIVNLEEKLATAQLRQTDLREGRAQPRKQTRREGKVLNLQAEALQELDSYIFTTTYKLRQAMDRLQMVSRKLQYLTRDSSY